MIGSIGLGEQESQLTGAVELVGPDLIDAYWRKEGRPTALSSTRNETPSQRRFLAIHHIIRERITLLKYPPGTVLDIDALAEEFGVSGNPIRAVL